MSVTMGRFARNGFLASMGAIIAGGVFILFLQSDGPSPLQSIQNGFATVKKELGLTAEPILVFFVSTPKAVAAVRSIIADDRVLAESPRAFALKEGRIIADSRDSAGDIVSAAGWVNRELKLMSISRKEPVKEPSAEDGGLPPGKLAELMQKDTLSYGEAMMLLDHI
jgi:hypothetical protein